MERLTEKRDGQNVIPLRQNGKIKWSICSAGLGDAPTKYLYGDHADRLAAIEDILGDGYDLESLRKEVNQTRQFDQLCREMSDIRLAMGYKTYEELKAAILSGGLLRLRKLVEADRDGKIPKYTIGDTIYDIFGDAWEVTAVERRLLAGEPKWIYRCGHIGTNDYCALWEFEVLTRAEAQAALRREQDG